jgi:acetyl esterase/lipase
MTGFLARALDAVVISPDYRLAPESPFPAALDDCMAALRWLRSNADRLGVDPDRIAVAGSSAGGGLAAALAQRCAHEHINLRAQALLYPMLDDRTALGIRDGAPVWSGTSNRFAWTCYLGAEPNIAQAPRYAAPARAAILSSSPPTWLAVGTLDVLCAEAVEFAGRLKRADVECDLTVVPGMYHAADVLVPWARSMRQLRRDLAAHLQRHLAS